MMGNIVLLEDGIRDYIRYCQKERKLSENTMKSYRIVLEKFRKFVCGRGDRGSGGTFSEIALCEITKETIRAYLEYLNETWKSSTARHHINVVQGFFSYLEENEIIQNLFEFDDMAVDEFATHRTDITLLWTDETLQQWEETIHDSRHTVYPVCEETVDHVVGVLNIKDFFRFRGRTKDFIMKHAVKPAQFIPKSVKADVLFRRMKVSHNHFAVVLDEYGGMVGIVTMNDLLEQLVGDLEDDLAELAEEPKISRISKDTWKIDGGVDLEDAAEALEVELPVEDYDTFGGFVFGIYGTIPSDGTQFEVDACGLHIKILSIKEHRLESAVVCKTTGSENAAEQERSEKNEDK